MRVYGQIECICKIWGRSKDIVRASSGSGSLMITSRGRRGPSCLGCPEYCCPQPIHCGYVSCPLLCPLFCVLRRVTGNIQVEEQHAGRRSPILLFSTNDYLGLSAHPDVRRAASSAASAIGMGCLLYTSPSPRDRQKSRMPSSA